MINNIKNKVVLITGGSLGIGRAITEAFVKNGAKVIICSRNKVDLERTKDEINSIGFFCDIMPVDVSSLQQVKKFMDYIVKNYSTVDILINCAGIYGPIGLLEDNDLNFWEQTIKINLIGVVNLVHSIIPLMKLKNQGKIINFVGGGIGGSNIMPRFSAYISSKFAVAGFTEVMGEELKKFNIQINAISPGAVNTRLLDQVLESGMAAGEDFLKRSKKQKEEGGISVEKATNLVLFLASKDSNFITGKMISANWDDYKNFIKSVEKIKNNSLFNLRRIDNFRFFEK